VACSKHEALEEMILWPEVRRHRAESSLRRHMTFEEHQVFCTLSRVLPGEDTAALARRVDAARRLAPSRPHTAVRSEPGEVRIIGLVMGAFDRGPDRFSRRG
jgi:hypothetical protein